MSMAIETASVNLVRGEGLPPGEFVDGGLPRRARHIVFYRYDALSGEMKSEIEATEPSARLSLAEPWLNAGLKGWDLTNKATASKLAFAICRSDERFDLLSWCIMPSHVHVLIVERSDVDVTGIVRGWMDSATLSPAPTSPRSAPLIWDTRFFADAGTGNDWVAEVARHIENDPVAAGLASDREAWRWSSAFRDVGPRRSGQPARSGRLPSPSPAHPSDHVRAMHVIFWLNDALPGSVARDLARPASGRQLYMLDKALDQGRGRRSLAVRAAAAAVRAAVLADDGVRYGLIAWCVMPTHVHVLFSEMTGWPLAQIVDRWKSATLNAANSRRFIRINPSPWATDYTTTELVGAEDIEDVKSYIEYNPVITGLAREPTTWPWSSASSPLRKIGGS